METWIYLLKVNAAIAVFYMVYRWCYRNDTFFTLRRYLLQGILFLSVVYPFTDFSKWFVRSHNIGLPRLKFHIVKITICHLRFEIFVGQTGKTVPQLMNKHFRRALMIGRPHRIVVIDAPTAIIGGVDKDKNRIARNVP